MTGDPRVGLFLPCRITVIETADGHVQAATSQQGYTVPRVQYVDAGLTTLGFKTDLYRVVFFANADELHQLTKQYPELVPYLTFRLLFLPKRTKPF